MKYAPDQTRLPFEKPSEQAVKLRSIDWRVTGMSEHCWRQIREILIAITYCSGPEGCSARRDRLMQLANDNRDHASPEVGNQRTFDRRHKQAVDQGLLSLTKRYRRTAIRNVEWSQVDVLIAESRALAEQARQQSISDAHHEVSIPLSSQCHVGVNSTVNFSGGSITRLTNNNSTKLLPTNLTGRLSTRKTPSTPSKPIDWSEARETANRVVRKLKTPARRREDRELVLKVAALQQRLGDHWLWDAVEAVIQTRPRRPYAYLHRCYASSCEELGSSFAGLLSEIQPPPGLLSARAERPDPRLCEVADG